MKPIWYFVGWILFIIGIILVANGIYTYFNPEIQQTVLRGTYPDIWWGALMTVVGLIYIIKNRKVKVE